MDIYKHGNHTIANTNKYMYTVELLQHIRNAYEIEIVLNDKDTHFRKIEGEWFVWEYCRHCGRCMMLQHHANSTTITDIFKRVRGAMSKHGIIEFFYDESHELVKLLWQ